MLGELEEVENLRDLRRDRDGGPGEKLREEDLDGVEPEAGPRRGAVGDTAVIETGAVVP